MFGYYKKSMRKIKEILREKEDLTEEEWNRYKTRKATFDVYKLDVDLL